MDDSLHCIVIKLRLREVRSSIYSLEQYEAGFPHVIFTHFATEWQILRKIDSQY